MPSTTPVSPLRPACLVRHVDTALAPFGGAASNHVDTPHDLASTSGATTRIVQRSSSIISAALSARLYAGLSASLAVGLSTFAVSAQADVTVIQPPTVVAASQPLRITLLFAEDSAASATPATRAKHYAVPATLAVSLASGDLPPRTLTLERAAGAPVSLNLRPGQFRRVVYSAPWPDAVRGTLRVQVADFNASPALVTLDRGKDQGLTIADNRAAQTAAPHTAPAETAAAAGTVLAAPGASAAIPASDASIGSTQATIASVGQESRLSYYEPMYIGIGKNGDATARFQVSFKYRVVLPADPRSLSFIDNLYFGYTQVSIWDLSAASAPFKDTSYKPSLFYYVADTGWRSRWFDSMGFQGGLEHESNGKAGADSRGINIAYVEPIVHFNTPYSTQLTIAPKVYYYIEKSDNEDIARYRGYADLQVRYGQTDGLQLFTTIRKGTHAMYGSVDAQLTYPVQKIFGGKMAGALGGFVWLGYFNGYGQSLLDYDNREHWNIRLGYSIYR